MTRILFDTSYLFPYFNLKTNIPNLEKHYEEILDNTQFQIYYSDLSLIEIKWQLIRLEKKEKDEKLYQNQYITSLDSLINDKRISNINILHSGINSTADKIRNLDHKDYFDTMIGASSLWFADIFVTEDKPLKKKIIHINNSDRINLNYNIFNWKEFVARIKTNALSK